MARLGDIAEVITKGTTPTSVGFDFVGKGIHFVKIESISENGQFIKDKFAFISDKCHTKLKRSQLQENDILFSIAGAIGRTAIVTKDILPANTNQALALIRIPSTLVSHDYIVYALQAPSILEQLSKKKQGVAQLNISLKDVSEFDIYLPDLPTQRRIAATLDKVSEGIAVCRQMLADLDLLVKSQFVEMFGEPIDNPMKWPVRRLIDLSTLITNGNTPKGGSENYVDNGITFLRSQNVWRNLIDLTDVAYIDETTHANMRKSAVHHNDILITKTGRINTENSSLGRAALYEGLDNSANINGHVYLVRLGELMNPKFVVTILTGEAYRKYIRKVCVGGIDKRQINLDQVEEFPIIVPPKEQQDVFAAFLEQTDKSKFVVQQQLAELETLKKSLMQEYFG